MAVNTDKNSIVEAFYFFIKASFFGVVTFILAKQFALHGFLLVVFSVFIFSIPIFLGGVYGTSIKKIHNLNIFEKKGFVYWLLSRRGISFLFWLLYSLFSSMIMLINFNTYSTIQWAILVLPIPIFYLVFRLISLGLSSELKPYIVNNMALSVSKIITSFVMVAVYFILVFNLNIGPHHDSLEHAIFIKKASSSNMNSSVIVFEIAQTIAVYHGIESYIVELLGRHYFPLQLLLLAMGSFFVFYNTCVILSCFLIPRSEYRRVFGPLTEEAIPSPLSILQISKVTALVTFGFFFIYIPFFSHTEEMLRESSKISEFRQGTEEYVVPKLEKIGDKYFNQGTLAQIQKAKIEAIQDIDASVLELERAVDKAFDRLEVNVDGFLDWYYSLKGEYARILHLLSGRMENYLGDKLQEYLGQDDPFYEVQATLDRAINDYTGARELYQEKVQMILENNHISLSRSDIKIVQQANLLDILTLPDHQDFIGLQNRLMAGSGGGAAAGLMTAAVVKKVVSKTLSKSTLKIAAKALAKVLTSKAGGAAGGVGIGATSGSAIGSAFPLVGTAAGGIIGGIIGGIAGGVAVDKLLIELEEHFHRDDFKRDLLSAINETRLEVKGKLNK